MSLGFVSYGGFMKILALLCMLFGSIALAKTTYISIGTGSVTGVYYPTGGAIAKLINKKSRKMKIKASVESTAGSVFNINSVVNGDLQFAIAQSDRQFQAYNGMDAWKGKKLSKLRSVFSLHPEIVTLVAAVDKKIFSVKDLKGKKVNIGAFGTGQRQNAIEVLKALGIDYEKDFQAESLKASEAPSMLQDSRIDAFFFTVGHPNGAIQQATNGGTKVNFVPIEGVDDLIKNNPYYTKVEIPVKNYPNAKNDKNVPSIGMKALLVTSENVAEDVVYQVTKEIFENLDAFRKLHPALEDLSQENMIEAMSAPIHKGALKYYKEIGLAKKIKPELIL